MQQVACPGCGAPVQFKSTASVMAVCEFCKTTLLKDATSVSNLGKMSEVLEDYSPVQIGTSGQFAQRSFSVIGRIQLQYSDGFWNEWMAPMGGCRMPRVSLR
jgi:ribosomal protein S27E